MSATSDGAPVATPVDTPSLAIEILNRDLPELGARQAVDLGESWFSYAYMVDGQWIFRFPRTNGAERAYRKERLLLPRLAPTVEVAVPSFEHVGSLPDGRTYLGHRAIRGEPLTPSAVAGMSAAGRDRVARQIAEFLRGVHAFPVADAREIGADEDELADEYEHYREDARRKLHPLMSAEAREECERLFARFLNDAANFQYAPVLRHADLWGRHILLDNTPSVAGIIDYGCVCLGDPDYDFFPLICDGGEAFARMVMDRYGHPDTDRCVLKGRFFGALDAIDTWLTGSDERSEWKVADGQSRLRAALTA